MKSNGLHSPHLRASNPGSHKKFVDKLPWLKSVAMCRYWTQNEAFVLDTPCSEKRKVGLTALLRGNLVPYSENSSDLGKDWWVVVVVCGYQVTIVTTIAGKVHPSTQRVGRVGHLMSVLFSVGHTHRHTGYYVHHRLPTALILYTSGSRGISLPIVTTICVLVLSLCEVLIQDINVGAHSGHFCNMSGEP